MIHTSQLSMDRENFRPLLSAQDSPLTRLPIDLILKILSLVRVNDIHEISLTCRGLSVVSREDSLWRGLYHRDFLTHSRKEHGSCYQDYRNLYSNIVNGVYTFSHREWTRFPDDPQHDEIHIFDLEHDLGRLIEGDARDVTSLIRVQKNLVSGHNDGSIKIWDVIKRKCVMTMRASPSKRSKTLLITFGDFLISSSCTTVKIWKNYEPNLFYGVAEFKVKDGITSLFWSNGRLHINHIHNDILDFTASKKQVYNELSNQFMERSLWYFQFTDNYYYAYDLHKVRERFSRMPKEERRHIENIRQYLLYAIPSARTIEVDRYRRSNDSRYVQSVAIDIYVDRRKKGALLLMLFLINVVLPFTILYSFAGRFPDRFE